MLYISRFFGADRYGVVDTDDGTESICDLTKIRKAVIDSGLTIQGVRPQNYNGLLWLQADYIDVYQPADTVTKEQAKYKTLLGLDTKMYKTTLTSITWDILKSHATIRLSSLCDSCADFILTGNLHTVLDKIILILDNNVLFGPLTFKAKSFADGYTDIEKIGMKFDIRELSDKRAYVLYESLVSMGIFHLARLIIDDSQRLKRMLDDLNYVQ